MASKGKALCPQVAASENRSFQHRVHLCGKEIRQWFNLGNKQRDAAASRGAHSMDSEKAEIKQKLRLEKLNFK